MKNADFAQSLVHKLAVPALAAGYAQLVETLRANNALGGIVRKYGIEAAQASDDPALAALKKGNKEFVTGFEKEAEKLMREAVAEHYPTHAIVGEEHGYTPGSKMRWVFDPIDGTSAMIRSAMAEAFGVPLQNPGPAFGITLALVEGDEPILGVVTELKPAAGRLLPVATWVGVKGESTLCNGEKIAARRAPLSLKEAGLTSTAPKVMFKTRESWGGFQALRDGCRQLTLDQNCVGFTALLREGSGLHVAYEADLAYHDAAALIPILQGAGLTVTGGKGEALSFAEAGIEKEYAILAASAPLHAQALACIKAGVSAEKNEFEDLAGASLSGYAPKFAPTSSPT